MGISDEALLKIVSILEPHLNFTVLSYLLTCSAPFFFVLPVFSFKFSIQPQCLKKYCYIYCMWPDIHCKTYTDIPVKQLVI